MGKIVLLDELTINKIAAGEVIERPASVIKEMVENSIDAGATNITVEIKNGGISYIKVTDNGKGIAQDDLEIAFERHATSKIRSAEDLDKVTSMGFRGEALASIAAIANVELISKTEEQDIGYKVVVEAGNVLQKEETACQTGTSITVRNLFFNTPVRYKFLKKDYTETGYIEDVVTRIALVNPNIAFKLINSGKTVIQTNGRGKIADVVYSIYGRDMAKGIIEVAYKYEDIIVKGVIGKPEIARSNRSNQLFFVNKRYIKDKTLTAATEQSYKGLIPIGKFGFVILNIRMNPSKVDVNVHPAKLEVRFEEENKVFQAVYHAIKDTLLKSELVANPERSFDKNKKELSFEERLRKIQEDKKENIDGLFAYRKNKENEIEKYTEQESKIKTNSIQAGQAVNTSDILEQLKKMRGQLEKEVKEAELRDISGTYELDVKPNLEETKKIEIIPTEENSNKDIEENREPDNIKELNNDNIQEINNDDIQDVSNKNTKGLNCNDVQEASNENIQELSNVDIKEVGKENNQEISNENSKEQNEMIEKTEEAIKQLDNPEISEEFNGIKEKIQELNDNTRVVSDDFNEMYRKLFGTLPISEKEKEAEEQKNKEKENEETNAIDIVEDNISMFDDNTEHYSKPQYKFIGIVFKTYIILEINNEMYILDQHAAHERIMYEKVKKNYYESENKDSQMLLLPDIITLTHKEMNIAKDNIRMFEQAGFTLEEFGENTIKLTGVPTVCFDIDNKELFLETLDEINTVARTAKQEKEEKFIATVACKAAVKANMALTEPEVDSLMDKLLQLPNPFTCPHGRPTVIKMSKYDIERKFARK